MQRKQSRYSSSKGKIKQHSGTIYSVDNIVDAPEHYNYARAMGLLTWGTWDSKTRSAEERVKDLMQAYPLTNPAQFQGSMLTKINEDEYGPAESRQRLTRICAGTSAFGSIAEVLARYGLRLRSGPQFRPMSVDVRPINETARLRNQRLRILHGGVDIEAVNMDQAKLIEIEKLEKRHAAEQVRNARDLMRRELGENHEGRK